MIKRTCRDTLLIALSSLLVLGGSSAAPAKVAESAGTGEGLELVAEIPIEGATLGETATIRGRDYAFVSEGVSAAPKLHVIDISAPERPRIVASLPCGGNQGNVQVAHDNKTVVIGIDAASTGGCMPAGEMGFVTVDIRNPRTPRVLGHAILEKGSHSLAAHPTKPFVYNGEGFPEAPGRMQVWSIKDPAHPKLVTTVDTGAHSPHDLAFNRDGSMLATANAIYIQLMDTTDPTGPVILHTTQCPGCVHTHEARFTPDSKRLIVNDEYPSSVCPGGAIYFYDIADTGGQATLDLTGSYTISQVGPNANGEAATKCTPHIFDLSTDGTRMAASWHEGGLRYLDISETAGVTVGAQQVVSGGPRELASFTRTGGMAFSAKLHKGPYIHVVDANIGFQVFKVSADA